MGEDRMEVIEKKKKKKKKKRKKKKRKGEAQVDEGIPVKRARKSKGSVKTKCTTCLKEFYEEYGVETMCPDCGHNAPERKIENEPTRISTICKEKMVRIHRRWTDKETQTMLKLHASNVDDDEIAKQLDRTVKAVLSRRINLKLRTQNPSKGTRRDWSALRSKVVSFMKKQKIASTNEVSDHIQANYPDIADEQDKTTRGTPYYREAVKDTLFSKRIFHRIGKRG